MKSIFLSENRYPNPGETIERRLNAMNSKYTLYLGVLLTLVVSSVSSYTSFFGFLSNSDMNAIFSIFLIILGLIITDRISTITFFDERLAKSIHEINFYDKIEVFPSANQAIEYFINIEQPISIVKNTIFKYKLSGSDPNQLYARGLRKKWYHKKRKLVGKNVEWHDLGHLIQDAIFDEFVEWAKKDSKRRYFNVVANTDYPGTNFLYILFEDGSEEVLFGWSYTYSRPMDNPVFRSNNTKMCKYFSALFDYIESINSDDMD